MKKKKDQISGALLRSSTKRLLKDILEFEQSNTIHGIKIHPLKNNIFIWHCSLKGPVGSSYEGGNFHLILKFPENYPTKPPTVSLSTIVTRSHVYGNWICLDLLETHRTNKLYSGWSTSYSALSILLQLQCYLFDESSDANTWGKSDTEDRKRDAINSLKYKCVLCGHQSNGVLIIKKDKSIKKKNDNNSNNKNMYCLLGDEVIGIKPEQTIRIEKVFNIFMLSDDIIVNKIFTYLNTTDLKNCSEVSMKINQLVTKCTIKHSIDTYNLKGKPNGRSADLICFHSKDSFKDNVLGIGLTTRMNPFTNELSYVNSPLDLLSYFAYKESGVRKSLWRESFEYWLPVFINREHGKRGFSLFKSSICEIYKIKEFKPECAIELLCKLMNTQMVNVMNSTIHCSIKALTGYSYFHRWLLYIVEQYPSMQHYIDKKIMLIAKNKDLKKEIPIIGDYLALLSVSTKSWNQINTSFIKEVFSRNVFWLLKSYPILHFKVSNRFRLKATTQSSTTMNRLIMFHVYFLENIVDEQKKHPKRFVDDLDYNIGQHSFIVQDAFQKEIFKIMKIKNYDLFFKRIGIKVPIKFNQFLLDSMVRSCSKGYHKPMHPNVKIKNLLELKIFMDEISKIELALTQKPIPKVVPKIKSNIKPSQQWFYSADDSDSDSGDLMVQKKWSPWTKKSKMVYYDFGVCHLTKTNHLKPIKLRSLSYISINNHNGNPEMTIDYSGLIRINPDKYQKIFVKWFKNPIEALDLVLNLLSHSSLQLSKKLDNFSTNLKLYGKYCAWLFELNKHNKTISNYIKKKVNDFILNPKSRTKMHISDIFTILHLSKCSNVGWERIKTPLIKELLARNIEHSLKLFPELYFKCNRDFRVNSTFQSLQNTLNLIKINYLLFGFDHCSFCSSSLLGMSDADHRVVQDLKKKFQYDFFNFDEFFKFVNIKFKKDTNTILLESFQTSESNGYHKTIQGIKKVKSIQSIQFPYPTDNNKLNSKILASDRNNYLMPIKKLKSTRWADIIANE